MRTLALWVCLSSVCSRAYHQNCTSNLHQLVALCNCNVTYGCGPARFSSGCGVAIGYVLPVLRLSKKKYTQRDSTGGSTDLTPQRTGAESDIYVRSLCLCICCVWPWHGPFLAALRCTSGIVDDITFFSHRSHRCRERTSAAATSPYRATPTHLSTPFTRRSAKRHRY